MALASLLATVTLTEVGGVLLTAAVAFFVIPMVLVPRIGHWYDRHRAPPGRD